MKTGVILANTGSPSSPEPEDVEAYLRQFLTDPYIRQLPERPWKLLVNHVILPKRRFASAERYSRIWRKDGSPLIADMQRLVDIVQRLYSLQHRAHPDTDEVLVRSGMSYGQPALLDVLEELRFRGCERIVLLPLYPQSAFAPTKAVIRSFKEALKAMDWLPDVRIVEQYGTNPLYVKAIADSIRATGYDPAAGDRLLLSFHAIPLKDERAGDTYRSQVEESAGLVACELGVDRDAITVGYQSVFGPKESDWVSPLTRTILDEWRGTFDGRVILACPGFAIDCLETIDDVVRDFMALVEFGVPADDIDRIAAEGDDQAAADAERLMQVEKLLGRGVHIGSYSIGGRFVGVQSLGPTEEHARIIKDVLDRALAHVPGVESEG
ncbi:ferrochelatase [Hugonella massiliensis]|uniref:ferrochelatase n=1 Tax=Hugonella massiliensis TaxID=1720315 RepID=UPI00073E363C|nr:ferrochelatase [Hugonella massiliensis]